jgi:mitogen-activated protein kinase 15
MTEEIESNLLTRFKVIKKLGSGAYGHVFRVQDKQDNKIKALKKNFDAFTNSTDAQRVYR